MKPAFQANWRQTKISERVHSLKLTSGALACKERSIQPMAVCGGKGTFASHTSALVLQEGFKGFAARSCKACKYTHFTASAHGRRAILAARDIDSVSPIVPQNRTHMYGPPGISSALTSSGRPRSKLQSLKTAAQEAILWSEP